MCATCCSTKVEPAMVHVDRVCVTNCHGITAVPTGRRPRCNWKVSNVTNCHESKFPAICQQCRYFGIAGPWAWTLSPERLDSDRDFQKSRPRNTQNSSKFCVFLDWNFGPEYSISGSKVQAQGPAIPKCQECIGIMCMCNLIQEQMLFVVWQDLSITLIPNCKGFCMDR